MVRPEGVEPPAYRFEACRSIQLSYGRATSECSRLAGKVLGTQCVHKAVVFLPWDTIEPDAQRQILESVVFRRAQTGTATRDNWAMIRI